MSISPPESPSEQHPPERFQNPKADAKAAKAYAKAMRPWYKKKRIIIPAGLAALVVVASAGSSGGTETDSANTGAAVSAGVNDSAGGNNNDSGGGSSAKADESSAKGGGNSGGAKASSDKDSSGGGGSAESAGGDAEGGTDGASATVGQAVTNAGTTYKVTSVKTTKTIGDPDFLGARADGVFVIVSLELTNNKDETKTFLEANAKIKTSDDNEYETSSDAVLAFGDESLMLKDIQPDLTTRGKMAFEIPPSKVSGSTLVIEDLWGSGEIKVDLGL